MNKKELAAAVAGKCDMTNGQAVMQLMLPWIALLMP